MNVYTIEEKTILKKIIDCLTIVKQTKRILFSKKEFKLEEDSFLKLLQQNTNIIEKNASLSSILFCNNKETCLFLENKECGSRLMFANGYLTMCFLKEKYETVGFMGKKYGNFYITRKKQEDLNSQDIIKIKNVWGSNLLDEYKKTYSLSFYNTLKYSKKNTLVPSIDLKNVQPLYINEWFEWASDYNRTNLTQNDGFVQGIEYRTDTIPVCLSKNLFKQILDSVLNEEKKVFLFISGLDKNFKERSFGFFFLYNKILFCEW